MHLPQLHFISTPILHCTGANTPTRYWSKSDQGSYIRLLTGKSQTQHSRSSYHRQHPSVWQIFNINKMSITPTSGEVPPGAGTSSSQPQELCFSFKTFAILVSKNQLIIKPHNSWRHNPLRPPTPLAPNAPQLRTRTTHQFTRKTARSTVQIPGLRSNNQWWCCGEEDAATTVGR